MECHKGFKNLLSWGPESSEVVAAGLCWFFSMRVIYTAGLVMGDLQDWFWSIWVGLWRAWINSKLTIAHPFHPQKKRDETSSTNC